MAEALVARAGRATSPAPGAAQVGVAGRAGPAPVPGPHLHRDAALVVAGNRPTKASLPEIEEVLDSLVAVAFPPAEALRVILSIGNYVIGCAVERQAEEARTADPERDTRLLEQAAELPRLRAAIAGVDWPGPAAGDAGFEYGLGLLIEGVRARHAELLSAAPGRPVPAG